MKNRDVEAQPGDNLHSRSGRESLDPGADARDEILACPDCGLERTPGAPYCEHCGHAFGLTFEATRPLAAPKKADLSRADQARRVGTPEAGAEPAARGRGSRLFKRPALPTAPLRRTTVEADRPMAHAAARRASLGPCPACGTERSTVDRVCSICGMPFDDVAAEVAAQVAAPRRAARVTVPSPRVEVPEAVESAVGPPRRVTPHPLSRLRLGSGGSGRAFNLSGLVRSLGLGASHPLPAEDSAAERPVAGRLVAGGSAARGSAAAYTGVRPRLRVGLPRVTSVFGFAGLTAVAAIVVGLLVTLPSEPSTSVSGRSIYGINWRKPTASPVARLDFGPYFTILDNELLMLGTSHDTSGSTATWTTAVWATGDGSTWTRRSGSDAFFINDRHFVAQGFSDDGQGQLVAVGNSIGSSPTDVVASAWHSRDGTSWAPMDVVGGGGQELIAGVASRPGAVVAAGNGVAWLSTDNRSWSSHALPGAVTADGSYTPRVVGSWNGGFVIIGYWNGDGPVRSAAWYSSTGRDWTVAATSLDGFYARGIAGTNSRIVAVGSDLSANAPGSAVSWSSEDGSSWTKVNAPSDQSTVPMDGLTTAGDGLLAWGAPPIATSGSAGASATPGPTATPEPTATPVPTATPGPTASGATPAPTALPGGAPATEVIWVSENGIDWVPLPSSAVALASARVATIGARVIMVGGGSSGLSAVSGDLVIGPARGASSYSAPPLNYALSLQSGSMPGTSDITKVFTLGPLVAVGDQSSDTDFFLFATGPTGTSVFRSPYGGSLWVLETAPAKLTAQGVTGRPVVLRAIPDGNGGILAAGKVTNTSGDNGMIWHMSKSGTWAQVELQDEAPPQFSSIAAGPGGPGSTQCHPTCFVASSDQAGGSPIMYSTDGDTWYASAINVGNGFALSVAAYHYGFVAVGTDPTRKGATTAWSSTDGRTWTLRTDWHLPANVTEIFGMGYGLVATAKTTAPVAKPSVKPTPTPVPATSITWWWSTSGVNWQASGLVTTNGSWAIVNGQVLVLDAPAKGTGSWTPWTSPDGRSWRHPASGAISFQGAKTCFIASIGSHVALVGWDAPGRLKDYYGLFAT